MLSFCCGDIFFVFLYGGDLRQSGLFSGLKEKEHVEGTGGSEHESQALDYYGRMPISCCVEPSYLFFSLAKEQTNDKKPHTAPLTSRIHEPTSMERYITTEIDCRRRRHHQELHLLLLITLFLPCFFCFFLCSLTTFFMSFFISSNCKASTSSSSSKNLK